MAKLRMGDKVMLPFVVTHIARNQSDTASLTIDDPDKKYGAGSIGLTIFQAAVSEDCVTRTPHIPKAGDLYRYTNSSPWARLVFIDGQTVITEMEDGTSRGCYSRAKWDELGFPRPRIWKEES